MGFIEKKNIDNILTKWLEEVKVIKKSDILYTYEYGKLNIYTTRPMILIGEHGNLFDKYMQEFELCFENFLGISFVEVEKISERIL